MQTGFIKKLLFRGILFARSSGRRAFSFALEKTSSFTVISEIRKTRSDRLFQRATPFLFSSFSFQIYTKRERKREKERKRACRAPIKRSTLFFIPPSTLPRPLIPSFPFTFLFFKPSPLPSLSIPLRRSSFYILYVYLRPLFYSTFYFLSRFYPLIAVLSIPLFASTSLSSRFLFPHSSIIFLPPYAPLPHPPASLSLSLSLPACRLVLFRLYPSIFVSVSFHQPRPLIITLFRALPGNSLLFFARFATRAVARATDKFCRDIAFGIIAIMSTKYLPCRPSRVCQPASASPRRVAPRV